MFGDWGHGICLLLGALFLVARERKFGSQVCMELLKFCFTGFWGKRKYAKTLEIQFCDS